MQDRDSRRSIAFVARRLELHHRHMPCNGVQHSDGESIDRLDLASGDSIADRTALGSRSNTGSSPTQTGAAASDRLQEPISGMGRRRWCRVIHASHHTACRGRSTATLHGDESSQTSRSRPDQGPHRPVARRHGEFLPRRPSQACSPRPRRELREELERNPLAVLPTHSASDGPLEAVDAELVGSYAVRIRFSDGHDTGLYTGTTSGRLTRMHPAHRKPR